MPRKQITDLIEELRSWLPNYDHGPTDYPTILYRVLAAAQGGEELEDMGYEPIGNLGWHELDQLGRVLVAIQDKRDVSDLIAGLIHEEGEEVDERRMREDRSEGVRVEYHPHDKRWYVQWNAGRPGEGRTKGFSTEGAAQRFATQVRRDIKMERGGYREPAISERRAPARRMRRTRSRR